MIPDHLVLFDGVCNLCNSSVQRIIRNDRRKIFYFASLQSETGRQLLREKKILADSIVYVKKGEVFIKSSAALRIALRMKFPYPLLIIFIIVPWFIRDWFYDIIAKNRYAWYGKKDQCMLPEPGVKERFLD